MAVRAHKHTHTCTWTHTHTPHTRAHTYRPPLRGGGRGGDGQHTEGVRGAGPPSYYDNTAPTRAGSEQARLALGGAEVEVLTW